MSQFECWTKGTVVIEADTADDARQIFAELVMSEPTEEYIAAEEVEEE